VSHGKAESKRNLKFKAIVMTRSLVQRHEIFGHKHSLILFFLEGGGAFGSMIVPVYD